MGLRGWRLSLSALDMRLCTVEGKTHIFQYTVCGAV